jgi:hypothetical protein
MPYRHWAGDAQGAHHGEAEEDDDEAHQARRERPPTAGTGHRCTKHQTREAGGNAAAAEGATIGQIAKALDWQLHSVRGAISGSLKKKQGLTVVAEKIGGERIYRITG